MCNFCWNIMNYIDYRIEHPYIFKADNNDIYNTYTGFTVLIHGQEGIDYDIENIKFCPYCGVKLGENRYRVGFLVDNSENYTIIEFIYADSEEDAVEIYRRKHGFNEYTKIAVIKDKCT